MCSYFEILTIKTPIPNEINIIFRISTKFYIKKNTKSQKKNFSSNFDLRRGTGSDKGKNNGGGYGPKCGEKFFFRDLVFFLM
jgi:hypothetical protein